MNPFIQIQKTTPVLLAALLFLVLWALALSTRSCSRAGWVLSGAHDRGRMRCAQFPHYRCWKHGRWLAPALFEYHWELQHRSCAGALLLNNGDTNTAVAARRFCSIPRGLPTQPWVLGSPATPSAGVARLSVIKRSQAKLAAGAARPLVLARSRARPTAKPTLLLALQRSKAPPAAAIRPMVLQRSATALATTTPPWGPGRAEMSPRPVT